MNFKNKYNLTQREYNTVLNILNQYGIEEAYDYINELYDNEEYSLNQYSQQEQLNIDLNELKNNITMENKNTQPLSLHTYKQQHNLNTIQQENENLLLNTYNRQHDLSQHNVNNKILMFNLQHNQHEMNTIHKQNIDVLLETLQREYEMKYLSQQDGNIDFNIKEELYELSLLDNNIKDILIDIVNSNYFLDTTQINHEVITVVVKNIHEYHMNKLQQDIQNIDIHTINDDYSMKEMSNHDSIVFIQDLDKFINMNINPLKEKGDNLYLDIGNEIIKKVPTVEELDGTNQKVDFIMKDVLLNSLSKLSIPHINNVVKIKNVENISQNSLFHLPNIHIHGYNIPEYNEFIDKRIHIGILEKLDIPTREYILKLSELEEYILPIEYREIYIPIDENEYSLINEEIIPPNYEEKLIEIGFEPTVVHECIQDYLMNIDDTLDMNTHLHLAREYYLLTQDVKENMYEGDYFGDIYHGHKGLIKLSDEINDTYESYVTYMYMTEYCGLPFRNTLMSFQNSLKQYLMDELHKYKEQY